MKQKINLSLRIRMFLLFFVPFEVFFCLFGGSYFVYLFNALFNYTPPQQYGSKSFLQFFVLGLGLFFINVIVYSILKFTIKVNIRYELLFALLIMSWALERYIYINLLNNSPSYFDVTDIANGFLNSAVMFLLFTVILLIIEKTIKINIYLQTVISFLASSIICYFILKANWPNLLRYG